MIDMESISWYKDGVTAEYVKEHADILADPAKMTPEQLCDAVTYCDGDFNPYSYELCRRSGDLQSLQRAGDNTTACSIIQKAARSFGIRLI